MNVINEREEYIALLKIRPLLLRGSIRRLCLASRVCMSNTTYLSLIILSYYWIDVALLIGR
jgi:hypothetical protein